MRALAVAAQVLLVLALLLVCVWLADQLGLVSVAHGA